MQHDYNLENQSGASFRADLNNLLKAIQTTNSGAIEPSSAEAGMLWYDNADINTHYLKVRNQDNTQWNILFQFDVAAQTWNNYDISDTIVNYAVATGGENTILLSVEKLRSYKNNQIFFFKATYDNTSTTTVNINSIGLKDVVKENVPLKEGDIKAGQTYMLIYSLANDNFELVSTASTSSGASSDFVKPDNSKPLFIKTLPASIEIPAGTKIKVEDALIEVATPVALSLNSNLDTGSKTPGTDYYVYAKSNFTFYISTNSSIATDRLIGGFHYGLVGESEAPTGNKTEAMMVEQRGIWEHSCWDLKFRPKAKRPEAMNYTSSGKWVDIYLMHEDYAIDKHSKANVKIAGGATDAGRGIPKIPLEFGGDGSVTYGKFTHFQAREIAACSGKELIPNTDFANYAYGVAEGTDSSTVGEKVVGNTEHYPALTSRYMEQATGTQWIWGTDIGSASGTVWESNTDSRGQTYGSPKAVIFGGYRADGSKCGSRCSYWNAVVSYSDWNVGCRFACDHLQHD